jgi:hypothetical protein
LELNQARVQHEDLDEGREAELPRLQDEVAIMQVIEQLRLRQIQSEWDHPPVLRLAGVEVVEPPKAVC